MASRPKSPLDSFNRDWQQSVAWAQSQGISPTSYVPVYQLDVSRIQNGEYAMGRAERNNAILAAHNPNQVTPLPGPSPSFSPTNVWHNAANDVGKIATGLIGVFTGSFEKQIWHSAQATVRGITDPASLDAPTAGGTISNWLNDTLLAFVPGAADVGTLLQPGKGINALLEHPILSALDVMPDIGGETSALARIAGRMGGPEARASVGALRVPMLATGLKLAGKKIGDWEIGGKAGRTIGGDLKGVGQQFHRLSVKDRLENVLAKAPGIGPLISKVMASASWHSAMGGDQYDYMMGPLVKELEGVAKKDPQGVALAKKVLASKDPTGGDSVDALMKDPAVSPAVKAVVDKFIDGPGRFVIEETAFRGGLLPYYDLAGDISMQTADSAGAKYVIAARKAAVTARDASLTEIDALEPHAADIQILDEQASTQRPKWIEAVTRARQGVFDRPEFQRTLEKGTPIRRDDQLRAVVGENGFVDDFSRALKAEHPDPATVEHLADAMMRRLSSWGVRSVKAGETPELIELYKMAAGWKQWAKDYHKTNDQIDKVISGLPKEAKAHLDQRKIHNQAKRDELGRRQKQAVRNLGETHSRQVARIGGRTREMRSAAENSAVAALSEMERQAQVEGRRLSPTERGIVLRALRQQVRSDGELVNRDLINEDLKYKNDQHDLAAKHQKQSEELAKQLAAEEVPHGELVAQVTEYAKAVKRYHDAVFDHPADKYRDPFIALWKRRLMQMEDTAAMKVATEKFLSKKEKDAETKKAIDNIRNDESYLAEYMMMHWKEILRQPDLGPEVARDATRAMREYRDDSRQELKLLISQGYKVPYIPSATVFTEDLGGHSISAVLHRGIKKPDIEKAKSWSLTPTTDDFAVGINKAVVQELDRQAKIHLLEDTLQPMLTKGSDLASFLEVNVDLARRSRISGGTAPRELAIAAREMGFSKFDVSGFMGGGRLPRWGSEDMYLPTEVVRALEKIGERQARNLLTMGNKVFRYSILGLSPRFDAHVIFGGAMMLALRSTPYIAHPDLIREAWRTMKDGTLPMRGLGHPVEESVQTPAGIMDQTHQLIFDEFHRLGGHDAVNMGIGENIELRQGVSRYAAKPIHALRALADMNFRFNRHVRALQYSMAWTDALGKWEREHGGRVDFEDPETGEMIRATPERAMKEAMHHVQKVFGNLGSMSPFERQIATTFVPFYGWQKHIISYIMSFPFDHPMRALILSQMAYHASNEVPLAYPIRLQFLHFLGGPDKNGNISAIDLRSLDPFRDVANYMSMTGVFESLNPAFGAGLSMAFGSQAVYGESSLYPGVTYNAFYGIRTASSGGNLITGAEQYIPQIGAIQSAIQLASGVRGEWKTNPTAATQTLLEQLNIPFVHPKVNLQQQAARTEAARYETAYKQSQAAFSSGDFSSLAGYPTVPNPLNPAYNITPAELEAMYNAQLKAIPGVSPSESMVPPPSPYGW